jgi:hypothetical protein
MTKNILLLRKGIFFTIDAFFCLLIIVGAIILMGKSITIESVDSDLHYLADDGIYVLSILTVGELNPSLINYLEVNANLSDYEKGNSVLDQILIYWAEGKPELSIRILNETITPELKGNYRFGFFADEINSILNDSLLHHRSLVPYKKFISGIQEGKKTYSYMTKISFTQVESKLTSVYHFFGGFIGQGNITANMTLLNRIDNGVLGMELELDINQSFKLYINDIYIDIFNPTHQTRKADHWSLNSSHSIFDNSLFNDGDNIIKIVFSDINDGYIGGGFIKLTYETDKTGTEYTTYSGNKVQKRIPLSGVSGAINIYDSFFIPGTVTDFNLFLNFKADHVENNGSFFLNIGNRTLYVLENFTNSNQELVFNKQNLTSSYISLDSISNKTIPYRLGYANLSYSVTEIDSSRFIDVFLVSDRSGSMAWHFYDTSNGLYYNPTYNELCLDTQLNHPDISRMYVARCIGKTFSNDVLKSSGLNQIGLASYNSGVLSGLDFTNNYTALKDELEDYNANGGTCTSCGVWDAITRIINSEDYVIGNLISTGNVWKYYENFSDFNPSSDINGNSWYGLNYDDSSWSTAKTIISTNKSEFDSEIYLKNLTIIDLWDMSDDKDTIEVDFSSGINTTGNTFGFDEFANLLTNVWVYKNTSSVYELSFSDNFQRSDSTNIGSDWTEVDECTSGSGYWRIYDNLLIESSNCGADPRDGKDGMYAIYNFGYDYTNYLIKSSLRASDDDVMGFVFRYQDTDNHYRFIFNNENNPTMFASLDKYVEGVKTNLFYASNNQGFDMNAWHDITIILQNSNISIYRGSTLITSVIDTEFKSGSFGTYAWNMYYRWRWWSPSYGANYNYIDSYEAKAIFNSSLYLIGSMNQVFDTGDNLYYAGLNISFEKLSGHYDGSATLFCNITNSSSIEENLFYESLDSYPFGLNNFVFDIKNYLNSNTGPFNLTCGVNFTNVPNTIIKINSISLDSYDFDDGWDTRVGAYGSTNNQEVNYGVDEGKLYIKLGPANTNGIESSAYGIHFYISNQTAQNILNGFKAELIFDYDFFDIDNGLEEDACIFARISNQTQTNYLGSITSPASVSGNNAIWCHTSVGEETSNQAKIDLSSIITDTGYYFLDFGLAMEGTSYSTEGSIASFDNILIRVYEDKINPTNLYYRYEFDVLHPISSYKDAVLKIYSDDMASIYINNILVLNETTPHSADYWNNITFIDNFDDVFRVGKNVIAVKVHNSNTQLSEFDLELSVNYSSGDRGQALIIMSDGDANACPGDSYCDDCSNRACCPDSNGVLNQRCTDYSELEGFSGGERYERAAEQVVGMACWAKEMYNISIYTVVFGDDSSDGQKALNFTATYCDNQSNYFHSSDYSELASIYEQIAYNIKLSFSGSFLKQNLVIGDYFGDSILYPNSYFLINYTIPDEMIINNDEILISTNTLNFGNEFTNGSFFYSNNLDLIETSLSSYSGNYWTNNVSLGNSTNLTNVFSLKDFNSQFMELGDPYQVGFLSNLLKKNKTNHFFIHTGLNSTDNLNGSVDNRLFYSFKISGLSIDPTVTEKANGCIWNITYYDSTYDLIKVPTSYSGSDVCFYHNDSFDKLDSYNLAAYELFKQLDVQGNKKLAVKLDLNFLEIRTATLGFVPTLLGPSYTEMRVWK